MRAALIIAQVLFMVILAKAITRNDLFSNGRGLDNQLPPGDDNTSEAIPLKVPIRFYGDTYESIFVNTNGLLSFKTDIPAFLNIEFPLDYPIIAPLYANVDTRGTGTVYYREAQDAYSIYKATEDIQNCFGNQPYFQPKSIFVTTWSNVGYHAKATDKTNTFQVVIISNGTDSFVEYLYPEDGIQWIQATTKLAGISDARAQAGFVGEDGRFFILKNSGKDGIRNIPTLTNCGEAGKFMYRVGDIFDNVEEPTLKASPNVVSESPKSCAQGGSQQCHMKAQCIDNADGYCCICLTGYYGNGKSCIKNNIPLRVNGEISGEINGELMEHVNLQAYVVVSDGRAYTALSNAPERFGHDMQTLSILGGLIGWLFAKPSENAKNGYQLTGGVFNHTAEIIFPDTREKVVIHQQYQGLDIFDQLKMKAEIKGSLPKIPYGAKLDMDDYEEQYSISRPGLILSKSTRKYDDKGTLNRYPFTLEQSISYEPCPYLMYEDSHSEPVTLKVAKNFIGFEARERIIRYGMSNKVVPFGLEDPCIRGRQTCGPKSSCVVENDNFKCVCDPGFQQIYMDNEPICVDTNECTAGIHNCDVNAKCVNREGSFSCHCNEGFEGDGTTCREIQACLRRRCHPDARCISIKGQAYCECNEGFTGDGDNCRQIDEDGCDVLHNCSPYATCTGSDQYGPNVCQCLPGYRGDGYTCMPERRYQEATPTPDETTEDTYPSYDRTPRPSETTDYPPYERTPYPPYERTPYPPYERTPYPPYERTPYPQYEIPPYSPYDRTPYPTPEESTPYPEEDNTNQPIENDDSVFSAHCDGSFCTCPDNYRLEGSYCFKLDEYLDNNYSKEEVNYPLPICFNETLCSCPHTFIYNSHKNRCIADKRFPHDTMGPSGNKLSCNEVNRCHPYAQCVYTPNTGKYQCKCTGGFVGDGMDCVAIEQSCEYDDICDIHASCLYDPASSKSVCVCNAGYQGDGHVCSSIGCLTSNDCEVNAECKYSDETHLTRHVCVCKEGYKKDYNDACIPKNDCNGGECAEYATCYWDSVHEINYCQCDQGYHGDGIEYCRLLQRGCDTLDNCDPNAECSLFSNENRYKCVCKDKFYGDGHTCSTEITCEHDPYLCSTQATCVLKTDGYSCECNPGSIGNGTHCKLIPKRESNFLLLNQGMATIKVPMEPTLSNTGSAIQLSYYQMAIGLDVDCQENRVYWSDITGRLIKSSFYDGSMNMKFLTNDIISPEGLSIDWISRNIFWTDSRKDTVEVANLDTKVRKVLVNTNLVDPRGIAVHPYKGKIFWSDWNRKSPKIEWANMDGSDREIFLNGPTVTLPNSLAIDWDTDELCYADAGTKTIECVQIDTMEKRTAVTNCSYPFGLAITPTHFYWTDWTTQKIERLDKKTGIRQTPLNVTLAGGGNKIYGMAAVTDECRSFSNLCQYDNGQCPKTHLCLLNGKGGRTCVCGTPESGQQLC